MLGARASVPTLENLYFPQFNGKRDGFPFPEEGSGDRMTSINIDWRQTMQVSQLHGSLQIGPGFGFGDWKLAQEKPFYAETLAALQELGASFVRYQGWHNRPDLTVAANDAGDSRQVWDFSKIDPPLLDFLAANGGRPFILYVSYHFYALYKASEMHSNLAITVFDQADEFIESLRYVCAIRDVLSPRTGLMITEIGTMNQGTRARPAVLLRLEIQLSAAMYAYLYSRLAALGVKAVHISGLGLPSYRHATSPRHLTRSRRWRSSGCQEHRRSSVKRS